MDKNSRDHILFAQVAKSKCKGEASKYELCKKGDQTPNSIQHCASETKTLYDCFRAQMKVEPLCLQSYNDAKDVAGSKIVKATTLDQVE